MTGPMDYIHETTCHQLRRAIEDIENGEGVVGDFDYNQELDFDESSIMYEKPPGVRIVTIELSYILPE